ncbi:MAG: SNF2-related protein, partial [Selenomonadaceae bacterium]
EYKADKANRVLPEQILDSKQNQADGFYVENGQLYQRQNSNENIVTGLSVVQFEQVRTLIRMKDAIHQVLAVQKNENSDEELKAAQQVLNSTYDAYEEQYGRINSNKDLKKLFGEDPAYPLLRSLEIFEENNFVAKSAIFTKRTINPYLMPDHADTAMDALAISMQESARVDIPYMASLMEDTSAADIVRQLEFHHIYYDPEKEEYQLAEEYLSGDICAKIEYIESTTKIFLDQRDSIIQDILTPFENIPPYEPQNDMENTLLERVENVYMLNLKSDEREYLAKHLENRALFLAIASKNQAPYPIEALGKYNNEPLFALNALQNGRYRIDKSQGSQVLAAACRSMGILNVGNLSFPKITAPMYNFLKEKLATYIPDRPESLTGDLRAEWKSYQAALEERRQNIIQHQDYPNAKETTEKIEHMQKNLAALSAVKPKNLEASEIQIELGAPWISPEDIKQFLVDTMKPLPWVERKLEVLYSPATGNWRIEGKTCDEGNARVELTYGLKEMNAYMLIEHALNLKEAKIFKVIYVDGQEKRVVDQKATILAQQKQELIKNEFSKWIWKDPARRQRITTFYNRHFNNIRPREYNGDTLTFPGMNAEINLRKHQKDAIAHTIYGGNTLLAHCVGAGKTYEMVASIMEAKRIGVSQKAMVVVPKHLTEQFGTEFLQLYPAAKILIATQKDFEQAHRKEFCAKIATQDWDAVIMGYTQFEKIPLSAERLENVLKDEIQEILDGIAKARQEGGNRFTIKQMELSRKKLQARLEKLAESKTDQTVTFEELGVDRLYVDEAHYFKNLYTYTKMQNIPGITTTDAKKTMDMYEKCRYLNEKNGAKGIVFATGTPISNSMTELFTMQRYLQPDRLEAEGLKFFDTWATTFGKTVTAVELSPEGKGFRSKTRFAKFHNLPELMNMFKEIADIKTADMLNLPVPKAEFEISRIKPSETQKQMVTELAERAERIRNGAVSPEDDNMLKITNEGRKLALDQRLMNTALPDYPDSKVNQCVQNVLNVYKETTAARSTQMVFCDLSTPTYGKGFSVYDDIKTKLIGHGVPEQEIAFIHDAKNEKQKDALFEKVCTGAVRVILGSTPMMGTGTNVQNKLVALHDLDVPWRPSDLEQRSGRIIRQGNENKEVKVFRYVTEGTFDAYLWQIIENKQRFISQIMTSKTPVRTAEDIDEATLSYAEIKAIATENPLIKEKMDIDLQLERLKMVRAEYFSNQHKLEDMILTKYPRQIAQYEETLERSQKDQALVAGHTKLVNGKEEFSLTLNGKIFVSKKEAGEAVLAAIHDGQGLALDGMYRGMNVRCTRNPFDARYQIVLNHMRSYRADITDNPTTIISRMHALMEHIPEEIQTLEQNLSDLQNNFETAKTEVNGPFPQEDEFNAKSLRSAELVTLLNMDGTSINMEQEKSSRLENIMSNIATIHEDKLEKNFKSYAQQKVKANSGEWKEIFDKEIGQKLLDCGFSSDEVADVIFKFSPTVPEKKNPKKPMEKLEKQTNIAACR